MKTTIILVNMLIQFMAVYAISPDTKLSKADTNLPKMIFKDNDTFLSNSPKSKPMWQDNPQQGYFVKNGKLMQSMHGKIKNVTGKVTLSNGVFISTTGMVKTADGNIIQLKDGDWIDLNGVITNANK